MTRPVVLIVLDGWGVAPANRGNAIRLANTPFFDAALETYPAATLQASGEAVGLPWGEMGNSEVGHTTIGAGRTVFQDLPRITRAIADGSFYTRPALLNAVQHVRKTGGNVHLAGLLSNGGIHSFNEHLYALLDLCKQQDVRGVFVHAFLDGRDTPYDSGKHFVQKLQKEMADVGVGKLASMSGRFFAMDRDRHWDRTEQAYRAMADGTGATAADPLAALQTAYTEKVYDEAFPPTTLTEQGRPVATVADGDAVIFFNFRNDRMRQITKAFLPTFDGFERGRSFGDLCVVTMTVYEEGLPVQVAFPKEHVEMPLAKVVSDAGKKQLHIAETEKYAHVTFFFNGGREAPFPGEDRVLVPSPQVATFDKKPSMGAAEITEKLVDAIASARYDFCVANFANADMVGHTGVMPAIVEAVETVDRCLARIAEAVAAQDGALLITADHGNAEQSVNLRTGEIDKEHSTNPVPFLLLSAAWQGRSQTAGRDLATLRPIGFLSDVAPTVLEVMGLPKPATMTGHSLLSSMVR